MPPACDASESNDTAFKLVRYYNNAIGRPNKKKIIARVKGYHGVTAAAASMIPAPQSAVVQSRPVAVGNTRAVVWILDKTSDGVSAGFLESISDAMPATCGVAMLVPCLYP